MIELRHGRWEDVLADVERVDAVITDTPFSQRQHAGYRSGTDMAEESRRRLAGARRNARATGKALPAGTIPPGGVPYAPITEEWAHNAAEAWAAWDPSWIVVFGDDTTQAWWKDALQAQGLYVFAPVIWVKTDGPPRFQGDGPASSCEYMRMAARAPADGSMPCPCVGGCWPACEYMRVARPKRKAACGSLPGYYMGPIAKANGPEGKIVTGQKPLWLMRAIIRDYTRPGMLIADPCAGGGTTLLAARQMGRSAIGAEMDAETFEKAQERLAASGTLDIFDMHGRLSGEQGELL